MQAMGKARRNNKRIARPERNHIPLLTVKDLTAGNKANLKIIVIMGPMIQLTALDPVNVIMPLGGMKVLQGDKLCHVLPPLVLSVYHSAVRRATKEGYLRATMKHPLTGFDPGDNVGNNVPNFTYQFVPGGDMEVTYVAKGGGSECFGGTRHRVVAFADGIKGIEKFVIDSFVEATRSGGICPPNVLGIGIGGTANIAANLAKEAACLRTVGSHNPDEPFCRIEEDLYTALNALGVGIMGIGGDTSVLGVNVEYAYTHIAGICVAISSNCMVARRGSLRICADGTVQEMDSPNWFEGR